MLLDRDNPTRVIGKTQTPLLLPETDDERHGDVDNVVFPCGALVDEARDELMLYYGAADTRVCLATGSLQAVIDACKNCR